MAAHLADDTHHSILGVLGAELDLLPAIVQTIRRHRTAVLVGTSHPRLGMLGADLLGLLPAVIHAV